MPAAERLKEPTDPRPTGWAVRRSTRNGLGATVSRPPGWKDAGDAVQRVQREGRGVWVGFALFHARGGGRGLKAEGAFQTS